MAVNINHENDALIVSGSELTVNVPINSSNLKKNNWASSIAPTVNDDIDLGYSVGSRWLNISTDNEWVCTDNTDGAAVWVETSGGGGDLNYVGDASPSILPSAQGFDSPAMGDGANAKENYNIAIGSGAITGQTGGGATEHTAIAIGATAKAYETGGIAIGFGAETGLNGTSSDPFSIAIGYASSSGDWGGIALGWQATTDSSYQCVIGSSGILLELVLGGSTYASAGIQSTTIRTQNGIGTDQDAADIVIAAGAGTGTGAGGTILFKTATPGTTGTSINALVEAMRIEDDQIVTFAQSASFGDAATTRSNLGAASLGMVIALGG